MVSNADDSILLLSGCHMPTELFHLVLDLHHVFFIH